MTDTTANVARMLRNGAYQIETLLLVDRIDRQTLCRLPIIGDALTSQEIDELADNRPALEEHVRGLRMVADASDDPQEPPR